MSRLEYREVRFAYPDNERNSLDGIDFEVGEGEVMLLVGGSGSGKSTLLRCANGLVPQASGGRFGGEVRLGGRSLDGTHPRDLAAQVGFVHQDPSAQFVVDRVEADVAFVLENLGMGQEEMRRRVEEVLDALGVAHLRHRSPSTLSGGERQRVAIAGALAAGPSVLVLDEPTSELDPQGAEDVFAAVARLNADLGTTVLMAEHRLERAAQVADRALVLEDGSVTALGDPAEVLVSYPGAPPVVRLGQLLGWDPVPLTVRDARNLARSSSAAALAGLTVPGVNGGAPGDELLVARELLLAHRSPVLSGVDLCIRSGETWAVLGRNGSGKSTLLRALGGLHSPASGSLERKGDVALLPQDPNTLLFAPTVRRELQETLWLRGRADDRSVDLWLDRLGIAHLADLHPRSLSAGERQRVALGAVAVGGADVLLLDEPTRGIDAATRVALEHAIGDHTAQGGAVVLATHDVELAARVASQALVLGDGEVVAQGEARSVLSGSLFAPQVLRVLPPFLTVEEVAAALEAQS